MGILNVSDDLPEPAFIPNMTRVLTRPERPEEYGGNGQKDIGTLTMDPNSLGINLTREFYGSISLIHDHVVEKCENSNGQDCTPQPENWVWNDKEEVYSNFVEGEKVIRIWHEPGPSERGDTYL